jgi:serine/threonine protein kinase
MVGTPLYLAPEIFRGEPASVRTDVYSTGVLLYHLVTASFPHPVKTVDELRERMHSLPPIALRDARADLPATFVRVVSEAIAVDPEARCESAGALEQDLLEHSTTCRRNGGRLRSRPRVCRGRDWDASPRLPSCRSRISVATRIWTTSPKGFRKKLPTRSLVSPACVSPRGHLPFNSAGAQKTSGAWAMC